MDIGMDNLLRGERTAVTRMLTGLLETGDAVLAALVLQEILAGARDALALATLKRRFNALSLLVPCAKTYADAGALYARCRWRGITPRSPHDHLIGQQAIKLGLPLLHDDADFVHITSVEPRLALLY